VLLALTQSAIVSSWHSLCFELVIVTGGSWYFSDHISTAEDTYDATEPFVYECCCYFVY